MVEGLEILLINGGGFHYMLVMKKKLLNSIIYMKIVQMKMLMKYVLMKMKILTIFTFINNLEMPLYIVLLC
jgi:hypothetical protein